MSKLFKSFQSNILKIYQVDRIFTFDTTSIKDRLYSLQTYYRRNTNETVSNFSHQDALV